MATSATGGFLAPTAAPVYDDDLDDILHATIVGVTGVAGDLVRPRWQPEPPQMPAFDVNWCAFGIPRQEGDAFVYERHAPSVGQGVTYVERDELLYVLHSFYGPGAAGVCARYRDGLELAQNRELLSSHGVEVVEIQEPTTLPALVKEKWLKRVDVTVVFRRRTSRTYEINTIVAATGELRTDNPETTTPLSVP